MRRAVAVAGCVLLCATSAPAAAHPPAAALLTPGAGARAARGAEGLALGWRVLLAAGSIVLGVVLLLRTRRRRRRRRQ